MKKKKPNKSRVFAHSSRNVHPLEKITPLVRRLNSLDMKEITSVCINDIPELIGAKLVSFYLLDDESDILHLAGHNHPSLINNIVSLNHNPTPPMVTALRTKNILFTDDIGFYKKPDISHSQREYSRNYKTKNCVR